MILRRYIVRSLIGPFFIGFALVTFLLTMEMLLDLLDMLLGKGIGLWTVAQLFVLALGWMVALSIPCGVLVSALMTYGRLSQDNEIIAMRASGVHLMQVVRPALVLSVIVAVGLTLFNNYVLPETNYAYAGLMQKISRVRPTAEIREGVLIDDFNGYDLWIGRLDDVTGAMRDILILDSRTHPESPRTILARSGTLEYRPAIGMVSLFLEDGEIHEADPASPEGEYRRLKFRSQTLNITEAENPLADRSSRSRSQREMSIDAMLVEVRRLKVQKAHQDSLVAVSLKELPVGSVEELARRDPSLSRPDVAAALAGILRKVVPGHRPAPPKDPQWTAQESRQVETARARIRESDYLKRKISEYEVEIHKKFSIPVACIVFVLVGAPLGTMARRGGLAAGFFSVVFFLFYYLCLIGGEQLADRLLISPWLAMWLPNIVLGALGLVLMARAIASGQPARPQTKAVAA